MNPYYQNDAVALYCGDCREVLAQLDCRIDLVLTDPPYGRVVDEDWDRINHNELEELLAATFSRCRELLADNGALYVFCWSRFATRLELLMGEYFHVLNRIYWCKRAITWRHQTPDIKRSLEGQRQFGSEGENIIFAEFSSASGIADPYIRKSDEIWAATMRPLIEYFAAAKKMSGLTGSDIQRRMFELTGKRYVFDRHSFGNSQWEMPTREQYEAARTFLPLRRDYEELRRDYEELRRDYEELRRDYEELRRYHRPSSRNLTDFWRYDPILAGRTRLHPTEKPQLLLADMVTTSSRTGALILDPFAGSGATGLAAMRTGRRAILIEREEKYCEVAANRLEAEHRQLMLEFGEAGE